MSFGVSLTIFIVLIILLALSRTRLVYELSAISLLIFGSARHGVIFYSFIFLPGTIIHELSHWLVAELLQVRTGEITIFPDLEGETNSQRLGSVATAKSDPLRGFLIGLAPFLSGLGILLVLGQLFTWDLLWWQLSLVIYGVAVIGNSMMISREDRRTWPFIVVFFALIGILVFKYYPSLIVDHSRSIIAIMSPVNLILGVTVLLNLAIISGSYFLRRLVEKMTKRRIISQRGRYL